MQVCHNCCILFEIFRHESVDFDSGFSYILKGMLCLGFLKRAREEKETAKDRVVKDLQVSVFTR